MKPSEFFDKTEFITTSIVPKEKRRFTYYDLIKFAEQYKSEVEKLNLLSVSESLSEMDMDNAYDKGFADAMKKYRTDL